MIITVANRKGGVGKTTTAVFLAHALARATRRSCTIIDADPQASATQWARRAVDAGNRLAVPVMPQPTPQLALPPTPTIVIDTPPADFEIMSAAIDVADLVLVPTSPSSLDLSQVQVAVEAASRGGKQVAVLLTRTRRTRSVAAADESLRAAGVHVLRTRIALREPLAMAFGRPVRELHGYDLAGAEILDELPDMPFSVAAVQQRTAMTPPPQPRHMRTIGFDDDELIQRLKSSMARLTVGR